jgi:hypothetical protein
MSTLEPDRPRRNLLALILTTLIGVAATVGVGWYQLLRAEQEEALAEQERARAVRHSLVSIVEEYVLNGKPIALAQLARLVDQRRRDERIAGTITISEILEQTEFNILNTRYLPFERKEALKPVFNALYLELSARAFAAYPKDMRNADLLNDLARQIQEGKPTQALEALKRLQEAHVKDLEAAESGRRVPAIGDALREIVAKPGPLVATFVVYILLVWFLFRNRRRLAHILLSFLETREDREERRHSASRREEALKLLEGLTPEAKALAVEIAREHLTTKHYDRLLIGPMAKAVEELRKSEVLVRVTGLDKDEKEIAAFYFPARLARAFRQVMRLIAPPPVAARDAARAELRRVGYLDG